MIFGSRLFWFYRSCCFSSSGFSFMWMPTIPTSSRESPPPSPGRAPSSFLPRRSFLMAVYWLILPRTIAVSQEGLILKFRAFSWNIPFATIKSIKPASGIIVWWAHSWITSCQSQIEIIRKYGLKIRVSASRRDQFLEYAHKAFADWKNTHPA